MGWEPPQEVRPQHNLSGGARETAAADLSGAFSRSPQLAIVLLAPTPGRATLGKAPECQVQALIMQGHCADQMAKCMSAPSTGVAPGNPERSIADILLGSLGDDRDFYEGLHSLLSSILG